MHIKEKKTIKLHALYINDKSEDSEKTIQLISKYFQRITTVNNIYSAISLCKQDMPNLIITDIKVGNNDVSKLIRNIKNINSSIKVIIYTHMQNTDEVGRFIKLGVSDYIIKNDLYEIFESSIIDVYCNLSSLIIKSIANKDKLRVTSPSISYRCEKRPKLVLEKRHELRLISLLEKTNIDYNNINQLELYLNKSHLNSNVMGTSKLRTIIKKIKKKNKLHNLLISKYGKGYGILSTSK